jgi:two-component system response regulator
MTDSGKFILLAEDDAVVAELVMHGLAASEPPPRVVHLRDGVDTLDFLFARERYAQRPPGNPAVVLLDIKMPRLDGLEVLRQIKADDRLRTIPVVMLTSSQDERDVRDSYQLGANAYIVKPVEFRRFMEVLRELNTFWMRINLPPAECSLAATVSGDDSAHSRHDTSLKH